MTQLFAPRRAYALFFAGASLTVNPQSKCAPTPTFSSALLRNVIAFIPRCMTSLCRAELGPLYIWKTVDVADKLTDTYLPNYYHYSEEAESPT